MKETTMKKTLIALVLILVAVISFFLAAPAASSAEHHAKTIQSLDNKITTTLTLTEVTTLASTAISALPGDLATPVADKIANFSEDFLLILCVLFTEKYLITLLGKAAFAVLIPACCLVGILSMIKDNPGIKRLAWKMGVISLALYFAIPVSIGVADNIYATYEVSINETVAATNILTEDSNAAADSGSSETGFSGLSDTVRGLINRASGMVKQYVESVAVLLVTTCVIPLLGIAFFIWLAKSLTGVDVFPHLPALNRRGLHPGNRVLRESAGRIVSENPAEDPDED